MHQQRFWLSYSKRVQLLVVRSRFNNFITIKPNSFSPFLVGHPLILPLQLSIESQFKQLSMNKLGQPWLKLLPYIKLSKGWYFLIYIFLYNVKTFSPNGLFNHIVKNLKTFLKFKIWFSKQIDQRYAQ